MVTSVDVGAIPTASTNKKSRTQIGYGFFYALVELAGIAGRAPPLVKRPGWERQAPEGRLRKEAHEVLTVVANSHRPYCIFSHTKVWPFFYLD